MHPPPPIHTPHSMRPSSHMHRLCCYFYYPNYYLGDFGGSWAVLWVDGTGLRLCRLRGSFLWVPAESGRGFLPETKQNG
jgi:hypothetical protein